MARPVAASRYPLASAFAVGVALAPLPATEYRSCAVIRTQISASGVLANTTSPNYRSQAHVTK
ncbi:hypothetical protein ACRE_052840 [Hapsidospora chrysogenum ATCC 11550]|uniref:Uncharacterized protein n=1 Tax=Hapsidospora chrysogenum (strain ATCC 11550 / CBS 779.69 / DSM 880 / IAM 14645 / JCM 23072 / IMI 49137) TaxID=857340 RepID=A0A086T3J8_HAPC1|nr:hypothetical protein ACRE_052840 [Hapsidospora chrysogenum ATCC 11550]